jgi:hypothetical protein
MPLFSWRLSRFLIYSEMAIGKDARSSEKLLLPLAISSSSITTCRNQDLFVPGNRPMRDAAGAEQHVCLVTNAKNWP